MSTYTPNYQLHQWEPEDHFLRSDFNQDFSRIDTAIQGAKAAGDGALSTARSELAAAKASLQATDAKKCEVYAGTYSGDNQPSRSFNLGFQPVAVFVEERRGYRVAGGATYGGLAVRNCGLYASGGIALSITSTGFTVYYDLNDQAVTNMSGCSYMYLAFK